MRFANYFIKKKISNLLKDVSGRTPRFYTMADAKDILVVFNIMDKKEIEACLDKLREFKKNVHVCAFIPKKGKVDEAEQSWITIHEDDLDSKGVPTDEMCSRFTSIPADILMDFTRGNNYAMHYLLLRHPASFKVGNKPALREMYDMTISATDDDSLQTLFDHILFYLMTIRSK